MAPKKFNFGDIMAEPPRATIESKVSITPSGQMLIPYDTWTKYGMEGIAVKVQWDPSKRALAFKKILTAFDSPEWDKRTMRLLNVNTATGKAMRVPLGKLLKPLGLLGVKRNGIVMEKYHDALDNRDYYYVILPKNNETTRPTSAQEHQTEVAG